MLLHSIPFAHNNLQKSPFPPPLVVPLFCLGYYYDQEQGEEDSGRVDPDFDEEMIPQSYGHSVYGVQIDFVEVE